MMRTVTMSFLLAGCVGDAPSSDVDQVMHDEELQLDQTQHLVVRVKATNGREVAFREPEAGRLLITQIGHHGVPPIELPGDPIAAFHTLAPDLEIPSVLDQAVARTNGAPGDPPARGEAVEIDTTLQGKASYSFPQSAFQCWVKNRVRCEFYDHIVYDTDFYNFANQQYNGVWAVDGDYVHTTIETFASPQGNYTSYSYETYDGWWRTFSITGTFGMWVDMYSVTGGANTFHYSTARQQ